MANNRAANPVATPTLAAARFRGFQLAVFMVPHPVDQLAFFLHSSFILKGEVGPRIERQLKQNGI
jgi:hypothetical protein